MPASVVLVTHNSGAVVGSAVASIACRMPDAEIVIVDNASTDDTMDVVKASIGACSLRVVSGHGNVGFGSGVNLGVQASSCDLILVLNPDTIVLDVHVPALPAAGPREVTGIVGCAIASHDKLHYLVFRQGDWYVDLRLAIARWFLTPRRFAGLVAPREVSASDASAWIGGAAFFVGRDEFKRMGGFDERYFLYREDRDLSQRYRRAGLPLRTSSSVTVSHEGGASSSASLSNQIAWGLLGLIQHTAIWRSRQEAIRAARLSRRYLTTVAWAFSRASRLPGAPEVVHRKAAVALGACDALDAFAAARAGFYPDAHDAMSEAAQP